MLAHLISSKTRIKLLLKFFLNSNTKSYLRGLAEEFDESTNAVRLELNRLERANLLASYPEGNKKYYQANTSHPLFCDIQQIVRKHVGIDQLILNVVERIGNLDRAYLTGPFVHGTDSSIIDVVLIGEVQESYLSQLIKKVESIVDRRIRYIKYTQQEWSQDGKENFDDNLLLIWDKENQLA